MQHRIIYMIKCVLHFADPYYLYGGCNRNYPCNDGKSCVAENQCPGGCYFAECLEHARSGNAEGFSFRGVDFKEPFCKICKKDQLRSLQNERNSGVYKKRGKVNCTFIYYKYPCLNVEHEYKMECSHLIPYSNIIFSS